MANENKTRSTFEKTQLSQTADPSNEKIEIIPHGISVESEVKLASKSGKKLTKKSTFELPIELHRRLKKAAAEREMTMLEIVEEALESHLK